MLVFLYLHDYHAATTVTVTGTLVGESHAALAELLLESLSVALQDQA